MKKLLLLPISLFLLVLSLNAQGTEQDQNIITEEEKIRVYEQMQTEKEITSIHMASNRTRSFDPLLDEVLDVPDFISPIFGGTAISFIIPAGVASSGNVVGFTFEGTLSFDGLTPVDALKMIITSPAGEAFEVGGTLNPFDNLWDFTTVGLGPGGNPIFSSQHLQADNGDPVFAPGGTVDNGNWTFEFILDDAPDAPDPLHSWTDVTITLHKTGPPAPVPLSGMYLIFSLLLMTGFIVYRLRM